MILPLSTALDCLELFTQGKELVRLPTPMLPRPPVLSLPCAGDHIAESSRAQLPCLTQKMLTPSRHAALLRLCTASSAVVPEPWVRDCDADGSAGAGHPLLSCSLRFDHLGISAMVSVR